MSTVRGSTVVEQCIVQLQWNLSLSKLSNYTLILHTQGCHKFNFTPDVCVMH